MDSFVESLNRLKDVHEKEVLGLQSKLLELNSERCRDAQRVEELFAKNQQLREQQKALKEHVRVLENRLRAGLCDRCMVTQELARRRQHEFENSHLQSLQHIFILTNEMNGLKEENRSLKEEVKRLRGLEDRPKPLSREGGSDSLSPPLPPSPGGRKPVTEKPPGTHEEAEVEPPSAERPPGYRTPPGAKISPGTALPEPRALDMSPQHISNQLHGTIAVVRPGSRACPTDRSATNGTPPPPARSSPPSPPYEHSLPLDSFLRVSRAPAVTYASLKRSLQADRLCLLHRHLSLHPRGPRSTLLAPAAAPASPRPQGLKAGEAWEEHAGLLDLPGALVDTRDPRLDSMLHALLAQQQLRARGHRARLGDPPAPGETPSSPPAGSGPESPESEAAGAALDMVALRGGRPLRPPALGSPRGKEAAARVEDHVSDKPLDLSDRGRSRDVSKPSSRPGSHSPPTAHTDSLKPSQEPEAPAWAGPLTPNNSTKRARVAEPEQPPTPGDPPPPLLRHHPSLPSPGGMGNEARGRPKPPPYLQRPDTDGHPDTEPSKADMPRAESEDLDELDSSDSEVAPSAEAGAKPSAPGEGPRCFCAQEHGQGLPRKQRRAWDPRGRGPHGPATHLRGEAAAGAQPRGEPGRLKCSPKGQQVQGSGTNSTSCSGHRPAAPARPPGADEPLGTTAASRKPPRGRRKLQEALTAEGPWSPRGVEDGSPLPSDGGWERL